MMSRVTLARSGDPLEWAIDEVERTLDGLMGSFDPLLFKSGIYRFLRLVRLLTMLAGVSHWIARRRGWI